MSLTTDAFVCECIDPYFRIALFEIINDKVSALVGELEVIREKRERDPISAHLEWMERTWESMIKGTLAVKDEFVDLPEC